LNLTAVAEALSEADEVVIVCAGRENRFALDDALCAGMLIEQVVGEGETEVVLNDAARVALDLASAHDLSAAFLQTTAAGSALESIGLEGDLEHCAALDRYSFVPEMKERQIRISGNKQET
jgi:2-phosphosulfolactate phosphatase